MKRIAIGVIALALLGANPTTKPATTKPAATKPVTDLYTMPDEAFAKLPRANASIDFAKVDAEMLSVVVLRETNKQRVANKLAKLTHLPKLDDAAKLHAVAMNQGKFFAHENPNDPTLREPIDRVKRVGLDPKLVAENIATQFGIQYESGKSAYVLDNGMVSDQPNGRPIPPHTYASFGKVLVEQWMNSPPHRHAILLPEAKYMGSWCEPATAPTEEQKQKQENEQDADDPAFHKFYCVQVFFTPMRDSGASPRTSK